MDNKLDYLKVNVAKGQKKAEKKKFMDNLKKHPELFVNFSDERLDKMIEYYLNENEEKRKRIEKKKAMLA